MYEEISHETILQRMISRVRETIPNIDTREGSVVYNALAPAAVELQLMYTELNNVLNQTFADTANREYLMKRCAERGIYPEPSEATSAIRKGIFNIDVPIGSRFSLGALNYMVTGKATDGMYYMKCETAGEVGNYEYGSLIPVDYIPELTYAELSDVLVPGEEEEETESLRKRYFASIESQAFGGNVADYKEKVNRISGVGGVKVCRVWNSSIRPSQLVPPDTFMDWFMKVDEIPSNVKGWIHGIYSAASGGMLTTGGTVRLVIIDSAYAKPSDALIDMVQAVIDPVENHGEGIGIAPIGHVVTVTGVEVGLVNIHLHITYQTGWDWESIRETVEEKIEAYFMELAKEWADSERLVIRISQIETRLVGMAGVLDITDTLLNGEAANLILDENTIPMKGLVTDG